VLAGTVIATLIADLAAGPTDDAVIDATQRYRDAAQAAAEAGALTDATNDQLIAEALGDLALADMTPGQLAVLYRARMITPGRCVKPPSRGCRASMATLQRPARRPP